jgi:hypothetical protein
LNGLAADFTRVDNTTVGLGVKVTHHRIQTELFAAGEGWCTDALPMVQVKQYGGRREDHGEAQPLYEKRRRYGCCPILQVNAETAYKWGPMQERVRQTRPCLRYYAPIQHTFDGLRQHAGSAADEFGKRHMNV